jgi:site-specific DNA-methyltransferase (adenine-specific)
MNEETNLQTPTQPPLVIADVSRCPSSIVYLEDCVQGLKRFADKHFDLAIVDPPYGINIAKWDKIDNRPKKEYWNELFRVSKNQIVWGGNYFNLPTQREWICWDKSIVKAGYLGKREFDEFELAWTSFGGKSKMIRFSDIGCISGFDGKIKINYSFKGKIHPTQKHINLYDWIFNNYSAKGDLILDTHLGSGSSRIAAYKNGFDFVGFEIDKDYYEAQEKRFKNFSAQQRLFWGCG